MMKTARTVTIFQRKLVIDAFLRIRGVDDRRLTLKAADGRLRDIDPDLVGNLQLHLVAVDAGNLAVDAAGRDDPVAFLQVVEKLLHFLLLSLTGEQDDEIEDPEDDDERNRLYERASAVGSR